MITKERLEELIKNGATIYHLIAKNYEEINANNIPQYKLDGWELYKEYYFETEEDARWELEMTATRTETLKLPRWEEFNKVGNYFFVSKSYIFYCLNKRGKKLYLRYSNDDDYWRDDEDWEPVEATKENYIEACKLAKKLFLGEEV